MYKILIADDEPSILEGLSRIINWDEYGIEIAYLAHNGAEALTMLKNQDVDILLTDIRMPKLDGLSLIRQLKLESRRLHYIILSGFDDFQYIKEALKLGIENYLLKPVSKDELSETLLATTQKLDIEQNLNANIFQNIDIFRENILIRWVANSIGERELTEKATLAGIRLDSPTYTAAVLRILDRPPTGSSHSVSPAIADAGHICLNMIRTSFAYTMNDMNKGVVMLFPGQGRQQDRMEIKSMLEQCIEQINQNLGVNVFVSIGSAEAGFNHAHTSYEIANELQCYSLIMPPNSIVDHQDVAAAVLYRERNFDIDYPAFDKLLNARMEVECLKFFDDLFDRLGSMKGLSPKFVQNMALEMLYHIYSTVKNSAFCSQKGLVFEVDSSEVYEISQLNVLINWLKNVLAKAIKTLRESEDNCSPHVKIVLSYIRQNYNKDVSIKQLSARFNINTAYLGQLFKNEVGELFTNYINNIRIEKAKELLLGTNLKVAEISERVGYPNTNYFYRIFKQITGISPTDFR